MTSSRNSIRPERVVPAVALGVVWLFASALSANAMTPYEQFAQMETQLKLASAQVAQLQTVRPSGVVLGASTAVPILPVCRLTTDKNVYKLGESIKFSWGSTGAVSGYFVTDDSGKDPLAYPDIGTYNQSNSVSIVASALGLPTISFKVVSATGHSRTCSKVVAVIQTDATTVDSQIAPLQAKLLQLQKKLSLLIVQREKVTLQMNALQVQATALQSQIDTLYHGVVIMDATAERLSYGGQPVSDLSTEFAMAAFTMNVNVTANDHDVFIPKVVASKNGVMETGFLIGFKDKNGRDVSMNVRSTTLASTASTEKNKRFIVKEGTSETFTITAVFYADKLVDNSYTFAVKNLSYYLNPDIKPTVQNASLIGDFTGDTGYIYQGSFGFKG